MAHARRAAAGALLVTFASVAEAQELVLAPRASDPADVETLDGIFAAFQDVVSGPAGERRDWVRHRTLYPPGVRFTVVRRGADGARVARTLDHGSWAAATPARERGFFEREIQASTRRFGPIADVFSTHEWSLTEDGPGGGGGINSLQLFHDGSRWWITAALRADAEPDTPIPPVFLAD